MKLFLLAGMCICLNGCALTMEMMAISGISYLATGKSLSDNAFSLLTQQDCAVHRIVLGEPLCEKNIAIPDEEIGTLTASTEVTDVMPAPTHLALTRSEKQAETVIARIDKPVARTKSRAVQAFALQPRLETAWNSEPDIDMSAATLSMNDFSVPIEQNKPLSNQYQSAEKFAVVGSFNSYKYAQHRNEKYLRYNAHIIQNPSNYPTKYRVVVGPIKSETFTVELPVLVGAETQLPWEIDLCVSDMSPPPCFTHENNNTFAITLNPAVN